jgi:hypothetical protein
MVKDLYAYRVAKNGAEFKIQATGQNWTLYVREVGKNKWEKIQSSVDAKLLFRIMMNQKEFKEEK